MKNKNTRFRKRFAVLVIAMITVFGMSFTSFAATLTDGKTGEPGTAIADGVTISKEIIFINDETTDVREPNITYEYTVSAASPAATTTIDDGTDVASVKAGVINAVTKPFTLTFNPAEFPEAGIYRYEVTETLASSSKTKVNVGITEAPTYTSVRYLDVYVEEASGNLQIYGYVLYDGAEDASLTTASEKSNGWVNTSDDDTPENVDVYTTHNVVVKKVITGAMADKSHGFPFDIALTETGVDGSTKIDVSTTGSFATTPSGTSGAYYITGSNATLEVLLSDGTEAELTGIPETATLVVTEKNDSGVKYKVSATKKIGDAAATSALDQTVVDNAGTAVVDLSSDAIPTKTEITYTNSLNAPSPTGIILHFWPFILISLLAIVLLVMSFRKKKA